MPCTSILSPAWNVSALTSVPTSTPSTESTLNSLKCFLGAIFAFAKCPLSGLFNLDSFTSPNPNWIALYPSVSSDLTCATTQGPASITVTGITFPVSSNI